jgi:AraC family transcriptional regulator
MGRMKTEPTPDRLRGFIDLLMESLDDPADGAEIARRAFLSRFHFDRLVGAALGETPGAFRRRLLLERAAYELSYGDAPVTDIALNAGYASLEAFERAFRRSFGTTPSAFRAEPATFRLPSPNGVHFHPPGGVLVPGPTERSMSMDLIDRMLEHDLWLSRRILDRAATLSDEDLDRNVRGGREPQPFESEEPTIRSMLDRLVFTREVWTAGIAGRPDPLPGRDTSIEGLRRRLEDSAVEFTDVVRGIRDRGEWDTAFVNALRNPPQSFTFGGMVLHVLTFQACRRGELIQAMGEVGVHDLGYGDPIEWERAVLDHSA